MKKIILVLTIAVFIVPFAKAQVSDVLDGVYVKEHVPARKPVPYHHLREADMMWSKKIWRMLDLREKINHPIYYPTQKMDDRYSLIDLLLYGVESEGLVVYNTGDDEFTTPMTALELDDKFGVKNDTAYVDDPETGEQVQKVFKVERNTSEVTRLLLKEVWYFDKQRAMLEVRIVGMCPIRMYERTATVNQEVTAPTEGETEEKDLEMKQVFWVYFPAARPLLANHEVFNSNTDSERRTFDDIFFKRRFSSYIFKETNVYDNRRIGEFKYGLDALTESDNIKDFIFKFEHDLWEY
ncbi:MAG: gliding motility protein GldN [Bacteroidia bacterium]|nr:gliding motility protein GldN [Bacteroidia bacterium]